MRFLSIILLLLFGSAAFAGQQKYGSFILDSDIPDTLFFVDEIKPGDSFELRKALRNHNVKNVVLASPGGSVFEGLQMAGIIFDRELRTYIPEDSVCVSSCAFLFFAGNERLSEGKLGVHQTYSGNFSEEKAVGQTQYVTQFTVSEIIGFLNEFGTPAFVYERMFQDIDMYYFNDDELKSLNSKSFTLTAGERLKLSNTNEQLSKASNENESTEPEVSKEDDNSPKIEVPADTNEVEDARKRLILKIQTRLKEIGCNPGAIDGLWGKRTEAAAVLYSKQKGLSHPPTGFITQEFLDRLSKSAVNSCPRTKTHTKKTFTEKWDGYVVCHELVGKLPRSIVISHLDANRFRVVFPGAMCGTGFEGKAVIFELVNGRKSGSYTFDIGTVTFSVEVDFERSVIKGSLQQKSLIENAANLLLLSTGKGRLYFSK